MKALLLSAAALGLVMLSVLHLCIGARPLSPTVVMAALFDYDPRNYSHIVVIKQRLSRLVVALGIGAMLAASGYTLQKLLRNDLVSPSTLGINSGAAAFSVGGIYFLGLSGTNLLWPALAGGISALIFAFFAADLLGRHRREPLNLVLGGAMSATLFSSATAFILSLDPDAFGNMLGWLVGDIGIFDYQTLMVFWPFGLLALVVLFLLSRPLDVLGIGAEQAAALGVNPQWIQGLALAAAVVLPVLAVTVAGPIGFVGLIVPHIARLFVGESGRLPLAVAMLLGSALLTGADILARILLAPRLLNVGTIMALVGGIAFLLITLMVLRRRTA
ncbi:FecCD family ABC transporter permease [Brenneria izbisi]|uniref:Iron ABC transporter permease n=1 Tax=Brenneria izbisi TaxID=2939450 RepID=A0AA41XW98_9GAMM|nr:iron ABC transporter permease [Brenneria izbisi]MCV9877646.1 iron ABC transporter permease [Brenneria izbisi]MCV9880789.1 iron ABC transporter permease [Brenneria izbisi]